MKGNKWYLTGRKIEKEIGEISFLKETEKEEDVLTVQVQYSLPLYPFSHK